MRVILAPGDRPEGPGRVSVDGDARAVDLSSLPTGIHVVKWNGADGVIEWTVDVVVIVDGVERLTRRTTFADFAPYQQYLDAWVAADPNAPPPAPTTLADAVQRKNVELVAFRKTFEAVGYGHSDGNRYDIDSRSITVLGVLAMQIEAGRGVPGDQAAASGATFTVWDFDGRPRQFTGPDFVEFFYAMSDIRQRKFDHWQVHRAAIDAIAGDTGQTVAARIAAIAAYDVTTGWPANGAP